METSTDNFINKRLLLLPLLVVLLVISLILITLQLYAVHKTDRFYESQLTQLARAGAEMVSLILYKPDMADYDRLADSFAKQARFRVTIIDDTGKVLGDSSLHYWELSDLENHANRPEILSAKEYGVGISRRYSATLNIEFLYVAVHYYTTFSNGYFRVALPLDEVDQQNERQLHIFSVIALGTFLLAIILTWLSGRHLHKLVQISKNNLETEVKKRTEEIETLQRLSTQLTACKTYKEALEVVRMVSSIVLPGIPGAVALYHSSKNLLEQKVSWNGSWVGHASYDPDQCWALRTGKVHLSDPDSGHMRCLHADDSHMKLICVPLIAQGVIHGAYHLALPVDLAASKNIMNLVNAIAEHTSLALANIELRENLRQQAIRDPLTGFFNRRYLLENFEHELSRAIRHKRGLSLLMIDLDHFKSFNDKHGHDAGDYVLREFSQLLLQGIRNEDLPCRYGGEEFCLLLPETTQEDALAVAEKLCLLVRENDFIYSGVPLGMVTISIGIATYPQSGTHMDTLMKHADQALYNAKNSGRNRARVWKG